MGATSFNLAKFAMFALALFCSVVAGPASAATPGELLEKAIYTEETVGNIDEAMKLYQQVVAEGKAVQETAAQAQYRLAMCYQKKGQHTEAKAAFQALVDKFPTATELVAQARKHLSTELDLLPAPWTLGERMQLNMSLATGMPIGTSVYMIDAAEKEADKETIRCSTRQFVTLNGASGFSEVFCQADNFTPFRSFWKHTILGEAIATYADSSVKIEVVGKDRDFTIDFTPPAFDNEQCVELFRRLPLAEGFKSELTVVTSLGGSKLTLGIEVPEKETLTVPAGTFDCFKVVLNIGQTFWISADEHRYVVRFAAGGINADLVKVWQAEPETNQSVATNEFALSLPSDWLSYEPTRKEPDRVELFLLDPRANTRSEVGARPKSTLDEAERSSPKAWTESFMVEMKNKMADFAVDESGIVETTIGGAPAARIVANFTDDGKQYRMLGVALMSDDTAAVLRFAATADKFDSLRKDYDSIVESFKFK